MLWRNRFRKMAKEIAGRRFCKKRLWWLSLCLVVTVADARVLPIADDTQVSYELKGESLVSFLTRFFADQGLRVVISEKLQVSQRTLNGPRRGTPVEVIQSIAGTNELVNYFDGSAVYVYGSNEVTHSYLAIPMDRIAALKDAIAKLQLDDYDNYTLVNTDAGLVEIIGVPRYVTQVQQLTQVVAHYVEPVGTVFKYIPLKYAWASDRTFTVGSRQVTVPGVANILRQVMQGGAGSNQQGNGATDLASPGTARAVRNVTGKSKDHPVAELRDEYAADLYQVATGSDADRRKPDETEGSQGSRIVADPYRNAVIVRDLPDRIRLYEDLVRTLDVPTEIVEIEATIIDVNIDKLEERGVDWRYGTNHAEMLFGAAGTKSNLVDAQNTGTTATIGQALDFQISAIIGNKNQFISRINLLESQGVVKVASRPKVATLNDLEAVIESSRSLYVPVEGAYDVDLFQVMAGTMLRVTPHIIQDGPSHRIRLIITIEDGTVTLSPDSKGVSNIPETSRNAVNTQAIVGEGNSLLLGGLVHDESSTDVRKVPFLGDIPLIGSLFRSESKGNSRSERIFMITPRLVTPNGQYEEQSRAADETLPDSQLSRSSKESIDWITRTCKGNCNDEYGSDALHMF